MLQILLDGLLIIRNQRFEDHNLRLCVLHPPVELNPDSFHLIIHSLLEGLQKELHFIDVLLE